MSLLLCVVLHGCLAAMVESLPFEPLLFMDLVDTRGAYGLIEATASIVVANSNYNAPDLDYNAGALVIAVLPSASDAGTFEVYAENTTGWEPLAAHVGEGGHHECALLRYTTKDFKQYSPAHTALVLPSCSGTPTFKSIARSPAGLYAMFSVGGSELHPGLSFTSTNEGMAWKLSNTTGVVLPDKDDLNLIWNQGRFVDMQIVWQVRWCADGSNA